MHLFLNLGYFVLFLPKFHYVAQAGLEILDQRDPLMLASASLVPETTVLSHRA